MNQIFAKNTDYEILTPNGWEDFDGVFVNQTINKPSKKITFADGTSITATNEHRFLINNQIKRVHELKINDQLDSNKIKLINNIEDVNIIDTYEIFNATNHVILANDVYSHQCDEFAFLPPNIATEFWASISPTLSTGGRSIITSTPNSDEDEFSTIWKQASDKFDEHGNEQELGSNGFYAFHAHWSEHPDRDDEWKKEEIGRIGLERFEREFECKFVIYDETLVNSLKLAELTGRDPEFQMGQVRWYQKPKKENTYCVTLDPSMGTGGDNSAIQVFELPTFIQVAEWKHNGTAIPGQIRILAEICRYIYSLTSNIHNIYWSIENNTIGEATLMAINDYGEENIPGTFLSEPKQSKTKKMRKGFNTTHSSKITACSRLKSMIENDKIIINSRPLISELKNFVASGASFAGKRSTSDDLVSALLLIIRMIDIIKDWDPRVYNSYSQFELDEEIVMPMPVFIYR